MNLIGFGAHLIEKPCNFCIIQENIKRPLAEELLFGSLVDGGHVRITVDKDDTLKLDSEPALKELEHLP